MFREEDRTHPPLAEQGHQPVLPQKEPLVLALQQFFRLPGGQVTPFDKKVGKRLPLRRVTGLGVKLVDQRLQAVGSDQPAALDDGQERIQRDFHGPDSVEERSPVDLTCRGGRAKPSTREAPKHGPPQIAGFSSAFSISFPVAADYADTPRPAAASTELNHRPLLRIQSGRRQPWRSPSRTASPPLPPGKGHIPVRHLVAGR